MSPYRVSPLKQPPPKFYVVCNYCKRAKISVQDLHVKRFNAPLVCGDCLAAQVTSYGAWLALAATVAAYFLGWL